MFTSAPISFLVSSDSKMDPPAAPSVASRSASVQANSHSLDQNVGKNEPAPRRPQTYVGHFYASYTPARRVRGRYAQ